MATNKPFSRFTCMSTDGIPSLWTALFLSTMKTSGDVPSSTLTTTDLCTSPKTTLSDYKSHTSTATKHTKTTPTPTPTYANTQEKSESQEEG